MVPIVAEAWGTNVLTFGRIESETVELIQVVAVFCDPAEETVREAESWLTRPSYCMTRPTRSFLQ